MAKRFTDTGKWDKQSFDGLNPNQKLMWIYLCDKCDHAGVWDVNYRIMSFHCGFEVGPKELTCFGDKICYLSPTKIFIPGFVDFQYGVLNPENRAHKSVLDRLEKLGAYKVLTRSSQGRKDKDKDKDKDKEKGECEGKIETLYSRYPLKKGKSPGLKKLVADLKNGATLEEMNQALDRFIAHHKESKTEKQFLPQFKTWATSWRDCLDPSYGQGEDFGQSASVIDYSKFKGPEEGGAA